jgi:hypothetical protein
MATNKLKSVMCNVPLYVTKDERAIWKAVSIENDQFSSMGDALRQFALAGLEQKFPKLAKQIREIRLAYALAVDEERNKEQPTRVTPGRNVKEEAKRFIAENIDKAKPARKRRA